MHEDLLQYIWSVAKFMKKPLLTTKGAAIKIVNSGYLNRFEGPDFKEAILKIEEQTWAGHVEVHIKSSDWFAHQHQNDENYKNVILHVVYEHNAEIIYHDGSEIPVLALKDYISTTQLETYRMLMYNELNIPCQMLINKVAPLFINEMVDKAMIDRMIDKSEAILELLAINNGNWNATFYLKLAENFGFKANNVAMLNLAKSIDLEILAKNKDSILSIEALLFGQTGFLNNPIKDDYSQTLANEYAFLQKKYLLNDCKNIDWKFVKTRPANFPTIRIAQFADLIVQSNHLFSKIIEEQSHLQILHFFTCKASEYWSNHFQFGKQRKSKVNIEIGNTSKQLILINTVVPFLFAYSRFTQDMVFQEKAIAILQSLSAEHNRITAKYQQIGFENKSAANSQGILGLSKLYCQNRKCLECTIGAQLIG